MNDDLRKNAEGYDDPTAYQAITRAERDKKPNIPYTKNDLDRYRKAIRLIFLVCELAGFHVEGRITLQDNKTGRIWR